MFPNMYEMVRELVKSWSCCKRLSIPLVIWALLLSKFLFTIKGGSPLVSLGLLGESSFKKFHYHIDKTILNIMYCNIVFCSLCSTNYCVDCNAMEF